VTYTWRQSIAPWSPMGVQYRGRAGVGECMMPWRPVGSYPPAGEAPLGLQVEFFTGSGTANGSGVAKDNKGNVYKVLF
jgi:hypothetical protein